MTDALRQVPGRLRRAIEGPDGPPLAWTLRGYRPEQLSGDAIAGLTVAALVVPLTIGYATVAGLPPEMGLYASLAPLLMYAVFGSGRRLIVGPDAASAALIGATLAPLAASSDDRVRLASALALIVAAIFLAMRLARMGFLADFLSRPILVGYLAGVGITVAVGQVEKILGGPVVADALAVLRSIDWTTANLAAVLEATIGAIERSGANLASAAVGVGVLLVLLVGRRVAPKVPIALPAMIIALLASILFDLQSRGVQVLGPVPAGLPPLGIPVVGIEEIVALLPGAVGIAILTFADTSATGRSFAARHAERTDANRELVALAAADAATAVSGGYPISSSPSRTSASEAAGSSTQLTGVIAAAAVAVVLVLLTGPLSYLPIPALGAVILVSVLGIIDLPQVRAILVVKRSEGAIALAAMIGVILYGTLVGVGIAVLLATLNIVRRAATPPIVEEVRQANGLWGDRARSPTGRRVHGVVVVRFTGPLFFANATSLQARIRSLVAARPDAEAVVLDLGATADIDLTAGDALRDLAAELSRAGVHLAVARPLGHVRDQLRLYALDGLMAATGGTRGNVDATIAGLGLDPTRLLASGPPEASGTTGDSSPGPTLGPVDQRLVVRVLGGLAGVVVAAVVIGILVTGSRDTPTAGPAPIPNLVGLPLSRANTAAVDAGFELAEPFYVRRDDQPEGTVLAQDPPAGTVADQGTAIRPIVSTVLQLVVVPDVIGMTESDAILALTGIGLQVRRAPSVYDQVVPPGVVVATSPPATTSVTGGTVVEYVVSLGPDPATEASPPSSARPEPSEAPASRSPASTVTPSPTAGPTGSAPAASATLPAATSSAQPSGGTPTPAASPASSPSDAPPAP